MDYPRAALIHVRGRLVFLAALCATFPLGLNLVGGADPGFHLAVGRWIAGHGAVPWGDVLAPGLAGHAYIDQSWMYQLLCFYVCEAAGFGGLSLLHALLYFAAALVFAARIRLLPAGWATTGLAVYGAWFCSAWRLGARPESVSWLLFGLSLLLLEEHRRGRKDALPWLIPIAVVWANCHAMFPLAWLASFCHLAGTFLEQRKLDKNLMLWGAAAIAASLLTPYGWTLWGEVGGVVNRAGTQPLFARSIPELTSPLLLGFQDPWNWLTRPDLLGFASATLLYGVLVIARRRELWSWTGFLMTCLFWAVGATSVRLVPFFMFVAVPEIVRLSAGKRVTASTGRSGKHTILTWALAGLAIFLLSMETVRTVHGARSFTSGQHFGVGLDKAVTYSAVGKFLESNHLTHLRLLNDPNSGGWLSWWTRMPVFSHGNMEILGAVFFERLMHSNGPAGPEEFIEEQRPEVVVVDISFGWNWIRHLENDLRWRRVFWDGNALVYVASNVAAGMSPPLEKAPLGIVLPDKTGSSTSELALLQSSPARGLRRYYFGAPTSNTLRSAEFAYSLDDWATAERLLIASLREDEPSIRLPGLLVALADCYDELGDGLRAQLCLARASQLVPANREISGRIRAIEKIMIERKLVPEGWAK